MKLSECQKFLKFKKEQTSLNQNLMAGGVVGMCSVPMMTGDTPLQATYTFQKPDGSFDLSSSDIPDIMKAVPIPTSRKVAKEKLIKFKRPTI